MFAKYKISVILSEMDSVAQILPYVQIVLAVLLGASILIQRSGAGLGGGFGEGSNWSSAFHTRRGGEKVIFIATIVIAILFALSAFTALIIHSPRFSSINETSNPEVENNIATSTVTIPTTTPIKN